MTSAEVYHSQPWFPGITSSSIVKAAAVVDTSRPEIYCPDLQRQKYGSCTLAIALLPESGSFSVNKNTVRSDKNSHESSLIMLKASQNKKTFSVDFIVRIFAKPASDFFFVHLYPVYTMKQR